MDEKEKYDLLKKHDLNTKEGRSNFIKECESSMLQGKNVKGHDVVLFMVQNESLTKVTTVWEKEVVVREMYDVNGDKVASEEIELID